MNIQHKNLWDEAKTVFRDKLITLSAYIRQEERSQINDLKKTWERRASLAQNKQKEGNDGDKSRNDWKSTRKNNGEKSMKLKKNLFLKA